MNKHQIAFLKSQQKIAYWDEVFHQRIALKLEPESMEDKQINMLISKEWKQIDKISKSNANIVYPHDIPAGLQQDYQSFCDLYGEKALSMTDFFYWVETLVRNNRIISLYKKSSLPSR